MLTNTNAMGEIAGLELLKPMRMGVTVNPMFAVLLHCYIFHTQISTLF